MDFSNDINKYPMYQYNIKEKKLIKIYKPPQTWDIWNWQMHHFVKRQKVKRNPELLKYQKLIFLPTRIIINGIEHNMHAEADNRHSKFEEMYGIKLSEVLYQD